MTIRLEIPDSIANELARVAKLRGSSAEEVAIAAIQKELDPLAQLDEMMAPAYAAMESSGITEEQAVEDFEALKHQLRLQRRAVEK